MLILSLGLGAFVLPFVLSWSCGCGLIMVVFPPTVLLLLSLGTIGAGDGAIGVSGTIGAVGCVGVVGTTGSVGVVGATGTVGLLSSTLGFGVSSTGLVGSLGVGVGVGFVSSLGLLGSLGSLGFSSEGFVRLLWCWSWSRCWLWCWSRSWFNLWLFTFQVEDLVSEFATVLGYRRVTNCEVIFTLW